MKKLFITLSLIPMLMGCNQKLVGKYAFYYAHIKMYGSEHPAHLKINSWTNDDGGIEIETQNYGTILLGDGTYILFGQDKNNCPNCPICGKVTYY